MARGGVLRGQVLDGQVDVAAGRLRAGVPHQRAQREQVDPRGGQLGAVGVAQPVRADPDRPGGVPVSAEQRTHPGLGHRLPGGGAAQHHEALLRGQPGGSFVAQVGGQLGEERVVDWDDPFPGRPCPAPGPGDGPGRHQPAAGRGPPPRAARRTASAARSPGPGGSADRSGTPRRRPAAATPAAGSVHAAAGPHHGADPDPDAPTRPGPRAAAPHLVDRVGTGLTGNWPAITRNPKKPRAAATRRFTVAIAAPRGRNATTVPELGPAGCAASRSSRTRPSP